MPVNDGGVEQPEINYVVSRLINQNSSAEGTSLPPRQQGSFRIPVVKNLKILRKQSYYGGSQFTLSWIDPDSISDSLSHFNVYVTGLLTNNAQPLGPFASRRSPAEVRVQSKTVTTVTFVVQTVLKNGQVSDISFSPSVSDSTIAGSLVSTDYPVGSIPSSALASSADIVLGAATLPTAGGVTYVSGASTITEDATKFFWDSTGKALAIGGNAPAASLDVTQATLGNAVQRLASVATNDDPVDLVYQNRGTTTNATPLTLHTFTVPATTTYAVEVTVLARRTGGSSGTAEDGARYKLSAVYKNVAGTATLIGALGKVADEDQAAWDATLTPASATVTLVVTGAANNNITWHCTARVYQVST